MRKPAGELFRLREQPMVGSAQHCLCKLKTQRRPPQKPNAAAGAGLYYKTLLQCWRKASHLVRFTMATAQYVMLINLTACITRATELQAQGL